MKKIVFITFVILTTGFSSISAQVIAPPPGAGDKNLPDTNIKGRSIELERIDREAKKGNKKDKSAADSAAEQTPEDKLAAKYDEIKTDYEQIQLSQDAVIKAYKSGEKIDYEQIGKSSAEINKSSLRLNSNLFPAPSAENTDAKKETKKDEKTEKEVKTPKSVREIIVDLDDSIGSFASSPMFQNLRVVDAKVSEKAKLDLEKIIELSALLNTVAQKMTATRK